MNAPTASTARDRSSRPRRRPWWWRPAAAAVARRVVAAADPVAFALLLAFLAGFVWFPLRQASGAPGLEFFFSRFVLPAMLLATGLAAARSLRASPIARAGALWMGYMVLTLAWSRHPTELEPRALVADATGLLVFFLGSAALVTPARRGLLRLTFVAAVASSTLVTVAGYLGGDVQPKTGRLYNVINQDHPNVYAHALGLAALLVIDRLLQLGTGGARWRGGGSGGRGGSGPRTWPLPRGLELCGWLVALALVGGTLWLTGGRLALLALAAGSAVLLFFTRGPAAAGIAAGAVLAALGTLAVTVPDALGNLVRRGDAGRAFIYEELWRRLAGKLWFGVGLAAEDNVVFPPGSPDFPRGATMAHAHSLFVGTLYFGGLVGLALLLWLLAQATRRAVALARREADPDPLPLALLLYGVGCLTLDGPRAVSGPFFSTWVLWWLAGGVCGGGERGPGRGGGGVLSG